jgi:hypothetical protein
MKAKKSKPFSLTLKKARQRAIKGLEKSIQELDKLERECKQEGLDLDSVLTGYKHPMSDEKVDPIKKEL